MEYEGIYRIKKNKAKRESIVGHGCLQTLQIRTAQAFFKNCACVCVSVNIFFLFETGSRSLAQAVSNT